MNKKAGKNKKIEEKAKLPPGSKFRRFKLQAAVGQTVASLN
jgi:hypothetical protein